MESEEIKKELQEYQRSHIKESEEETAITAMHPECWRAEAEFSTNSRRNGKLSTKVHQ